tara:strand:- start:86 stop:517 length:432 start_codon:yes stop_codon:yes gene_type:complete
MTKQDKVVEIENVNIEFVNKPSVTSLYETSLATLKEKISSISIRASTLHLIIKYVMEQVEHTPLKGSEQKELSLKLIRSLILDLTAGEDEVVLLQLLDNGTIGNMIELIVDATRGKLDINTLANVGSGCLNSCIPYWFSSKKK